MWQGYRVIDADAHMHEPKYLWERYVEPQYREQVPKVAFMDVEFMVYEPDGKIIPKGEKPISSRPPEKLKALIEKYGEGHRTWWAPETRLKDMDRYGWDIQVLLTTSNNGNFACVVALKDVELGAAMCRAYNNWCYEYCSADPKRLKFVALVPGSDVEEMVKETRRAVEELGAVAVRNPLLPNGKWLHEPEYNALWSLACELDFPIAIHGETRRARYDLFKDQKKVAETDPRKEIANALLRLDHAMNFPYDNMATLGIFIFAGILERFPNLRLGVLESNAGWVPFWLSRMDAHSHGRHNASDEPAHLSMLPSEYFMRQCTVTCDSDEKALNYAVEYLKGENIAWNTDYPHADGMDPPRALPEFAAQPISDEAKRKILWDNAVKLYGERILSARIS